VNCIVEVESAGVSEHGTRRTMVGQSAALQSKDSPKYSNLFSTASQMHRSFASMLLRIVQLIEIVPGTGIEPVRRSLGSEF